MTARALSQSQRRAVGDRDSRLAITLLELEPAIRKNPKRVEFYSMKRTDPLVASPLGFSGSIKTVCFPLILAGLVLLGLYELQDLISFFKQRMVTGDRGQDFYVYYDAARRFLTDANSLYEPAKWRKLAGFTYPPLAVLLFTPFAVFRPELAHLLFQVVSAGMLVVCSVLVLKLRKRTSTPTAGDSNKSLLFALLLTTSGPAFATFLNGQVGTIILALCLGALYLDRNRYQWMSGVVLAAACWIKIYPALLVVAWFSEKLRRMSALKTAILGAALPTLLLWLVPFELYKVYFLKLMPLAGRSLNPSIQNQSISASLVRLGLSFDRWFISQVFEVQPWIRMTNLAVMCALLVFISLQGRRRAVDPLLRDLFVLAFIPLIAPWGWGHSFLFSVPLIAYCIVFSESPFTRFASILAWILLLVPTYSEWHFLDGFTLVAKLFYFRYPIAVLAVALIAAKSLFTSPSVSEKTFAPVAQ
jgi:alpha-1,2-mannosyltransferase